MVKVGKFDVELGGTCYTVYEGDETVGDGEISTLLTKYRTCLPRKFIYGQGCQESYTIASIAAEDAEDKRYRKLKKEGLV